MADFDRIIRAHARKQLDDLGGVEAAAQLCAMQKTQLSNYANPDRGERIPLIVAMRLDEAAGNPLILGAAASLLGWRLVRTEDAHGDILTTLSHAAAETGALISAGIAAVADAKVTPSERRDLIGKAVAAKATLDALLAAIGSEGEE